jgi:hypothetical protein
MHYTLHKLVTTRCRGLREWGYKNISYYRRNEHINAFSMKSKLMRIMAVFEFTKKATDGFEVLTAVVMNTSIFWDITLYSSIKVNLRFGGTYLPTWRLHVPPERPLTFIELYGIIFQKRAIFPNPCIRFYLTHSQSLYLL